MNQLFHFTTVESSELKRRPSPQPLVKVNLSRYISPIDLYCTSICRLGSIPSRRESGPRRCCFSLASTTAPSTIHLPARVWAEIRIRIAILLYSVPQLPILPIHQIVSYYIISFLLSISPLPQVPSSCTSAFPLVHIVEPRIAKPPRYSLYRAVFQQTKAARVQYIQ
jgi:hypothetical protein